MLYTDLVLECREITLRDIIEHNMQSSYLGQPCIFENDRPTLLQSSLEQGEYTIREIRAQLYVFKFKQALKNLNYINKTQPGKILGFVKLKKQDTH